MVSVNWRKWYSAARGIGPKGLKRRWKYREVRERRYRVRRGNGP